MSLMNKYARADALAPMTHVDGVSIEGTAHWIRAALGRMPLEGVAGVHWRDRLPLRPYPPLLLRPLFDLVQPFLGTFGIEMRYRVERLGARAALQAQASPHSSPLRSSRTFPTSSSGMNGFCTKATFSSSTPRVAMMSAV